MRIQLDDIGRRYNREWIFRHIGAEFQSGKAYAILGPNGSGKSTLIKVLTGALSPSEGQMHVVDASGQPVSMEELYKSISIAAPYVDLIEDFTLKESIDFHFQFKALLPGYTQRDVLEYLGFAKGVADRQVSYFSSGMKQRLKLVLTCFSASSILFLDEPTSNLDKQGLDWYLALLEKTYSDQRLIFVGSNHPEEYSFCTEHLHIQDYK